MLSNTKIFSPRCGPHAERSQNVPTFQALVLATGFHGFRHGYLKLGAVSSQVERARAMSALQAIFGCVPIQNKTQLNLICNWSSEISGWTDLEKHWTYLKHHITLNILTPNRLLWKVVKLHCSAPEQLQWGGPKSSMVKTAADWAHLSHVISVKKHEEDGGEGKLAQIFGVWRVHSCVYIYWCKIFMMSIMYSCWNTEWII